MRRIFWDAMLFIYLLEGSDDARAQVKSLLRQALERHDQLYTSCLVVAEVMVGAAKSVDPGKAMEVKTLIEGMGFRLLPFDVPAIPIFSQIRRRYRTRSADAVNLSCAAAQKVDLFITADRALHRLYVPGIHFIADLNTSLIYPEES